MLLEGLDGVLVRAVERDREERRSRDRGAHHGARGGHVHEPDERREEERLLGEEEAEAHERAEEGRALERHAAAPEARVAGERLERLLDERDDEEDAQQARVHGPREEERDEEKLEDEDERD